MFSHVHLSSLPQAIANETGINFISVKGPELLNMVCQQHTLHCAWYTHCTVHGALCMVHTLHSAWYASALCMVHALHCAWYTSTLHNIVCVGIHSGTLPECSSAMYNTVGAGL